MIVEYTGRQFVVTEKYKVYAAAALDRIGRLAARAASAHIILISDKYRMIAEVTLTTAGQNLVAICESAEMMTALHDALATIEQQVVRSRQRTTKIMRHPRVASVRTMGDPAEVAPAAVNQ